MAARQVRAAIRDYLAPTPGVTRAFKDEPRFAAEEAWYTEDGQHGTVIYVHIDDEQESRFVLSGSSASGQRVEYIVSVVILYEYAIPSEEASADDWVDGLDDIIAALKTRLRADPSMGTSELPPEAQIHMAAQEDNTLHIARDVPKTSGGFVRSWNVLQFKASELV